MQVISADGHIDIPYLAEDIFRKAAPLALKDRVPHMEAPGMWTYKGAQLFRHAMKVPKSRTTDRMRPTGIFDGMGVPGKSRPAVPQLRREDQIRDGVEGDVIYGLLGLDGFMKDDFEAFRHCLLTYYRWVAEFAAAVPGRFAPLGAVTGLDPVQAAEDVHLLAEMGLKGVELRPRTACKPFWHMDWEPLWRAAASTGLPVHFHSDISRLRDSGNYDVKPDEANGEHYKAVTAALIASIGKMVNAEALGTMILSGVLDRHPRLTLVMGECDLGWIPHFLERMDFCVTEREHSTGLSLLPSEFWMRQCKATFQSDKIGLQLIKQLGVDNVMWGNDYPHPDGIWPNSRNSLAEQLVPLSDEERHKVVYANAAKLYGFDPVMDR